MAPACDFPAFDAHSRLTGTAVFHEPGEVRGFDRLALANPARHISKTDPGAVRRMMSANMSDLFGSSERIGQLVGRDPVTLNS
jgi:hypothetical protein